MKVLTAEVLGMCFGVRDALKILADVERPGEVTIHGELVHNEQVLEQLHARGFRMAREEARRPLPLTPQVMITAHGVSDVERQRLRDAGKELIDTTCPLVTRVHKAAQALQEEGYHVVVIGKRGHVEVRGVVEDLHSYDVAGTAEEVRRYPHDRIGVVCQTTATARNVARVRQAINRLNPHAEVRFVDTVCHPTKAHQAAVEKLAGEVEAMVVVGGRNSNNTRELVQYCRDRGLPTWHVQAAADLNPEELVGFNVVGLTAGTSTLDGTIDEVKQALEQMHEEVLNHGLHG
jgi:4-hydroxy-3-methylbut-2-enyl diphosphate reductase